MERFWRTLREGCLDHLGSLSSLHDVEVRLYAFLEEHYHAAPHSSLMGKAPGAVFAAGKRIADDLTEEKLHDALTVRDRRRLRADTTVSVDGRDWESSTRAISPAAWSPWATRCWAATRGWSMRASGCRCARSTPRPTPGAKGPPRRPSAVEAASQTPFDPAGALLDRATGKRREDER